MSDNLSAADVMALSGNDGINGIWNNPGKSIHDNDGGALDSDI